MNIKEFTESVITAYLESGREVNPDITLHIFQFIENNNDLLREYNLTKSHYKEVNPRMGQTIKEHFGLQNDRKIEVGNDECSLLTSYTRFR